MPSKIPEQISGVLLWPHHPPFTAPIHLLCLNFHPAGIHQIGVKANQQNLRRHLYQRSPPSRRSLPTTNMLGMIWRSVREARSMRLSLNKSKLALQTAGILSTMNRYKTRRRRVSRDRNLGKTLRTPTRTSRKRPPRKSKPVRHRLPRTSHLQYSHLQRRRLYRQLRRRLYPQLRRQLHSQPRR